MSLRSRRSYTLFGGGRGWNVGDWTASDDRVRGGKSQSYLEIRNDSAIFCGNLDIDTLGDAGFASQRTTGNDRHWDLSEANGIELLVDPAKSDTKRYTFIIKDVILPRDPETGREQSTTSWECEFSVPDRSKDQNQSGLISIIIPWVDLKPTYRGKEKDPGRPVKLQDIRRISIMMRSYFGKQQGPFVLHIKSITAKTIQENLEGPARHSIDESSNTESSTTMKAPRLVDAKGKVGNFWTRIMGSCHRL